MLAPVRPALALLAMLTVLFGIVYPAICSALLYAAFPAQSQGSLIRGKDGAVLGSALIGQPFTASRYFWGRLSATAPYPYNASASNGSNYGAYNPALVDAVKARIAALKEADPANAAPIPVDLVTASGSGLDPHISIAAAYYQLKRVARARGMDESTVKGLVERYTEDRQLGILGEPRVNVLRLNLALDNKL
ncbi:MAG: potassium-transporting ATPase subunit KdpC [Alphaproteobacteria bacterium]|nr:potassium-transporting ATPase subunit KdpC [Alphaproteobacteria bacterium]